ncbi:pyridoxamine 5'-phosphate oxidase [Halorubrum salipaludis]|uniref:Pyridoxamine 5'-phosphate oxidase n=1 Tax=Halorubrum salipaludis TaxID=2032630 RepID=A0A2A2FEH4_9EURY|nr:MULTISPECIES: pyridoxamine 5'-phosphate oxidase family protein [Halorubrum]PAU83009.1 pyridoxamine 5'-phosphate oxidase [Halorubrum salipaludis]
MTDPDVSTVKGVEMTDEQVDRTLEELGHGTLSLAGDGDAYGVPVSFGYDGERVFLTLLRFGEESRKLSLVEETETATLTAYETTTKFDWRSVIASGPLSDVAEADVEHMEETMDDNAWFPTIFPPSEPITGSRRVELRIESATGRKGEEYD